ncbi:MAG TPA: hypothetical protein VED63_12090, partial [Acidimicrobiales bacterium]|nr:hypothetical protein [Acidimicrobiales bacterium]
MSVPTIVGSQWRRWATWQPSSRTAWVFALVAGLVVLACLTFVFSHAGSTPTSGALGSSAQVPTSVAGTSGTANTVAGESSIGEGSTGGSSWLGGDGAGQPFAGESDGWNVGRSGSSTGATLSEMVGAPAGEVGAITGAVSSPPGP